MATVRPVPCAGVPPSPSSPGLMKLGRAQVLRDGRGEGARAGASLQGKMSRPVSARLGAHFPTDEAGLGWLESSPWLASCPLV